MLFSIATAMFVGCSGAANSRYLWPDKNDVFLLHHRVGNGTSQLTSSSARWFAFCGSGFPFANAASSSQSNHGASVAKISNVGLLGFSDDDSRIVLRMHTHSDHDLFPYPSDKESNNAARNTQKCGYQNTPHPIQPSTDRSRSFRPNARLSVSVEQSILDGVIRTGL